VTPIWHPGIGIASLLHSALCILHSAIMVQAAPAQQPRETDAQRRDRRAMVELIVARGVRDRATLDALRSVPRHEFVPAKYQDQAYADHPLPIGHGQTISQPYIVGYMTEMIRPKRGMKVLEVGTGSGYQAAILAAAGCEVFSIEIFEPLARSARERLNRLKYAVEVRHGDGHFGWPEEAPFDAILVTAAAGFIPPALVDQLKPGGRMLIPVGSVSGVQHLILVQKNDRGRVSTRSLLPVRFVPLLSGNRER
jgi:protein-L-isoaspartate(D-aspartate) O-methyltransferase